MLMKRPMLSIVAEQAVDRLPREGHGSLDDSLRAIIDACVSNVAVLDESGSIMYASKAWNLFERGTTLTYFESCRRLPQSDSDDEADITLADDIQYILFGNEREFHRKYYFQSLLEQRTFVIHAARLNLPGSTFRVLITHEELPSVRDDFIVSNERLIELLGTNILAWEGEVEAQRFTYVTEQAEKMLGYPAAAWYEPNFFASHIHADDLSWVLAAFEKQTRITEHFDLTFRMWSRDGRLVWVQNLVSVDSQNLKTHGFMIDVSERKRSEEALK